MNKRPQPLKVLDQEVIATLRPVFEALTNKSRDCLKRFQLSESTVLRALSEMSCSEESHRKLMSAYARLRPDK